MSTAAAVAAEGYKIHVAGLAPETSEEKLHDFFSFCGKLVSVSKTGTEADIVFEKLSAMRTSLMLNGGTLDGAHLEVTSATEEPKTASVLPATATGSTPIGAGITQEDKPAAAIVAEYLAHGYTLGDHVIERAIDFDQKQGISSRFLHFFNSLDKGVGERALGENQTVTAKLGQQASFLAAKTKEVDQQSGVSSRFNEYYGKILGTPVGQKVHSFYTTTQKQVLDVHEEARRIADDKKKSAATADPLAAASGPDSKVDAAAAPAPAPASTATFVPTAPGAPAVPPFIPL